MLYVGGQQMDHRLFLQTECLQRSTLVDSPFQLIPQVFNGVEVRGLGSWPFFEFMVTELILRCVLVIVLLEVPSMAQFKLPGWGSQVLIYMLTPDGVHDTMYPKKLSWAFTVSMIDVSACLSLYTMSTPKTSLVFVAKKPLFLSHLMFDKM